MVITKEREAKYRKDTQQHQSEHQGPSWRRALAHPSGQPPPPGRQEPSSLEEPEQSVHPSDKRGSQGVNIRGTQC